jgi:hypothetical protein
MWCLLCGRICATFLCPECERSVRASSFGNLYRERCPACGSPILSSAYPCPWCDGHDLSWGVLSGPFRLLCEKGKGAFPYFRPLLSSLLAGKEPYRLTALTKQGEKLMKGLRTFETGKLIVLDLVSDEEVALKRELCASLTGEDPYFLTIAKKWE